MPLYKQTPPPQFPITGYDASNKRQWAADGCWDYYGGAANQAISSNLGNMSLHPFYIKYDVPAGQLQMLSSWTANAFGQSGNSNVSQWGMYRVGSTIFDSVLIETVNLTDTSSYTNPTKSQTMASAYPVGWYIASIVFTAAAGANGGGSITSAFARNETVFGSKSTTVASRSNMNHLGVTGQTGGLPANLNSATLSIITYGVPITLRY